MLEERRTPRREFATKLLAGEIAGGASRRALARLRAAPIVSFARRKIALQLHTKRRARVTGSISFAGAARRRCDWIRFKFLLARAAAT